VGWPLVVADVDDPDAVVDLARSTRVVLTTVGPYLHRGLSLVRACAEAGTHYADLTGETLFVRRSIDAAHAAARASGARIVHACGFDSVPSDLGVGQTAARAAADGAGTLTDTVLHVRSLRGGVSGGTLASARQQVLEVAADPEARALAGRPDALVDAPPPAGPLLQASPTGGPRPRYRPLADAVRAGWLQPAGRAAQQQPGGSAVRARVPLPGGGGHRPRTAGGRRGCGPGGRDVGPAGRAVVPPSRALLDRVLPAPGQGPSDRALQDGRFRVEIEAGTTSGARYQTVVSAPFDPGYRGTAVMFGEAGLSLALDERSGGGGVLTPLVALGPGAGREAPAARFRAGDHAHRWQLRSSDVGPPVSGGPR
jgi:short subunit dehydrogenase-like uncharacterized protein